jgi:oligopeptide/dipeptide ABC transporter ATP-binding protein
LGDLKKEFNLSYLFIAHNLSVVEHIADRVAVMYLGRIVELGTRDQIFSAPQHPYTKALLSAIPKIGAHGKKSQRIILKGDLPSPISPPSGCHFHERCPFVKASCETLVPSLEEVESDHVVACPEWRAISSK